MIDYRLQWPGVIVERNGSNGNGNVSENDDDVDEGNYDGEFIDLVSKGTVRRIVKFDF